MARYLDPKNDLIFKKNFGEYKNLCISLLNALLPLDAPIESIEYNATELIPEIPLLKDSIVDVRCTDKNGSSRCHPHTFDASLRCQRGRKKNK